MKRELSDEDYGKLIKWAQEYGYSIRYHNHPKTVANWEK